ncbi:hypothetical protein RHSIM_Rhsim02G0177700 [Rhododendron simsii]|uniref:DUF4283 domain-containing protein n=1 Tax=Rhododendron simsii TaxID=118357 RepID=A0A834HP24_RHOSS|nr:hypothetical protein RHSIM_Rhsim02G0177700 [Rhododendron simsii]
MAEPDFLDLKEGSGETGVTSNLCLIGKVIQFEDEEDKRNVYLKGPWSVMNSLLVLHPLKEGMVISEIDFSTYPMWVRIHGLPVEKMSRVNAEVIGKRFGKLLALEATSENFLPARSFLLRGRTFTSREDGVQSSYGPDLRTGRPRKGAIPIEVIHFEIDGAEKRVNDLLPRWPQVQNCNTEKVDNLLHRQPESQSSGIEARGVLERIDCVEYQSTGQHQHLHCTGVAQSSDTHVTMTGSPYRFSPLSSPQGHLNLVSSGLSTSLVGDGPDPTHADPQIGKSKSCMADGLNSEPNQYFVTEPDSPMAFLMSLNPFSVNPLPPFLPTPDPIFLNSPNLSESNPEAHPLSLTQNPHNIPLLTAPLSSSQTPPTDCPNSSNINTTPTPKNP